MQPLPYIRVAGLAVVFAVCSSLVAQRAPSAPATQARGVAGEVPVELSPFTVTADKDVGYLAASTLAGSRLNTELKDTAASISVFTEEFMRDIGATDLADVLEYAMNAQPDYGEASFDVSSNNMSENTAFAPEGGGFRIRGIRATRSRNYFEWNLPSDGYNIGRIEDSRGPNAILFGFGSAGGVINVATKEPVFGRSSQSASFMYDKYGSKRGTLDVNRTLFADRLAVRLDLVRSRREFVQNYKADDVDAAFLSAKYRFGRKTTLKAEYEHGEYSGNMQSFGTLMDNYLGWHEKGRPLTYGTNPTTPGIAANRALGINRYAATPHVTVIDNDGRVINFANQNSSDRHPEFGSSQLPLQYSDISIGSSGPDSTKDSSVNVASAFLNQQLGENTFVELAFNHQDQWASGFQPLQNNDLRGDPNERLADLSPNPYAGRLYMDSSWVNWARGSTADYYRGSIATQFDLGRWGNYRLAAMGEYQVKHSRGGSPLLVWFDDDTGLAAYTPATPEAANNVVWRRHYATEGAWDTYFRGRRTLVEHAYDPVTRKTLSTRWINRNNAFIDQMDWTTTGLIGGQARYFSNRLVLGFGYRQDKLETMKRGAARGDGNIWQISFDPSLATEQEFDGSTRTLGAVYHLTPWLSLRGNRSSSLAIPNTGYRILGTQAGAAPGTVLTRFGPNPESTGNDLGFALNLFDGRVHVRATYYETTQQGAAGFKFLNNTRPVSIVPKVLPALVNGGYITQEKADEITYNTDSNAEMYDQGAEGWEYGVTANLTKGWRLQANFSITEAFQKNVGPEVFAWAEQMIPYFQQFPIGTIVNSEGNTLAAELKILTDELEIKRATEGIPGSGDRKYKINAFTAYTFSSGMLRGLTVGGGYQHQSKILVLRDPATGRLLWGNSFWNADAMVRYQFRLKKNRFVDGLNVQLNVANVFDQDAPLVVRRQADSGHINRFIVRQPRNWRLQANLAF